MSDNQLRLKNVEANVTVLVKGISPDEVRHTTPLILAVSSVRLVRPPIEVGDVDCSWS